MNTHRVRVKSHITSSEGRVSCRPSGPQFCFLVHAFSDRDCGSTRDQGPGWYLGGGTGEHCLGLLVNEFRDMALNGLFCADVLRPLDIVPLTDFTYRYHPARNGEGGGAESHT